MTYQNLKEMFLQRKVRIMKIHWEFFIDIKDKGA